MNNKELLLNDWVCDLSVDVCAITETWIDSSGYSQHLFSHNDYTFANFPRGSRGGGVGFLFKPTLSSTLNTFMFKTFESASLTLKLRTVTLTVFVVYRPSRPNQAEFLAEFEKFLDELLWRKCFIIVRDFNTHVNDSTSKFASNFLSLLTVILCLSSFMLLLIVLVTLSISFCSRLHDNSQCAYFS